MLEFSSWELLLKAVEECDKGQKNKSIRKYMDEEDVEEVEDEEEEDDS